MECGICNREMEWHREDLSDPRYTSEPDVQEFYTCTNEDCPMFEEPVPNV